ncbi:hypothetical protein RIF29_18844 [Crotalaria pallida]|uniref:AN1-type domain-containing protein n=1 Tax=Crotalaria pallida TaxID=3830 RepID=A0AAN9EYW6_CROPI
MAAGGTEAFPDLGKHCQHQDCNLLDFLPFTCQGCKQVFCLEHRSYKSHECPKSDHNSRKVVVCETCSISIETTGHISQEEEAAILEKHHKSGKCDPNNKKKPICPVKRCKGVLTFSNTSTCKTCNIKVCLKHRFPADHACGKAASSSLPSAANAASANGRWNNRFLAALASRNAQDCGKSKGRNSSSPPSTPSVKAY